MGTPASIGRDHPRWTGEASVLEDLGELRGRGRDGGVLHGGGMGWDASIGFFVFLGK